MKPISMFDPNSDRVFSGGSWYDPSQYARVACRDWWSASDRAAYLGFRLCLAVT